MIKFSKYTMVTYIVISILLIGCKSNHDTASSHSITYITKACFGKCPVYSFTLSSGGNASFTGHKNVNQTGNININIPKKTTVEIFNLYDQIDHTKKTYNANLRDFPEKLLIYDKDTIRIKGSKNVPQNLLNLIKKIETTVNTHILNN